MNCAKKALQKPTKTRAIKRVQKGQEKQGTSIKYTHANKKEDKKKRETSNNE